MFWRKRSGVSGSPKRRFICDLSVVLKFFDIPYCVYQKKVVTLQPDYISIKLQNIWLSMKKFSFYVTTKIVVNGSKLTKIIL